MKVYNNVLQVIGGTPLVKLSKLSPHGGASIYAKLEYLNPGGSVKDRMALFIIEDAERRGLLKPGGTIIENTSGNTGMGVAMLGALKGYRVIFTIPDKMSQEKINFLRAFGAKVVVTPTNVPPDSPESYYETAKRIAAETPNSFYVNQYHNPLNIDAHYHTTGPEIWEDMDGQVDYLVAGMGTGGTISGCARFLKEQNPEVQVIGVDPAGSVYYDYFKTGKLVKPRVYKVEGIGEDMLVGALDFSVIDDVIRVTDKECFLTARKLVREEGIFAGGSSGGAVWAALQVAASLEADKNVVVILPDSGDRYISKIYNDEWMRVNSFFEDEPTVGELLAERGEVISVTADTPVCKAVSLLKQHGISQLPVIGENRIIGVLSEKGILDRMIGHPDVMLHPCAEVAAPNFSVVDNTRTLSEIADKFINSAIVLICEDGEPEASKLRGVLTKIDLIDYYARTLGETQ